MTMERINLLLYLSLIPGIFSTQTSDYCQNSTLYGLHNFNELFFTEEIGQLDIGIFNRSKSLHCCAQGFLKIEWFKDGQPYPWPSNKSSFVIEEDSFNQSLIASKSSMSDSGVYTCIASNGSSTIKHDTRLQIADPELIKAPEITYFMKNQRALIGDFARFYCEGFVGVVQEDSNLSGAISWEKGVIKKYMSNAFVDGNRIIQKDVFRDGNQIVGSYLIFMKIELEDYDMYSCRLTDLNYRVVEQRAWLTDEVIFTPEEFAKAFSTFLRISIPITAGAMVVAMLYTLLMVPWRKIFNGLRIFKRKRYAPRRERKRKRLLIVFHEKDGKEVVNIVLPLLRQKRYLSILKPVTVCDKDFEKLKKIPNDYDRILAVMSLNLTEDDRSQDKKDLSLKILLQIDRAIFNYFTREILDAQGRPTDLLTEALKRVHAPVVKRKRWSMKEFIRKTFLNRQKKSKQPMRTSCSIVCSNVRYLKQVG